MKIPFQIVAVIALDDGSKELYIDIAPSQQVFMGYLLEGLDGYCYHTITDVLPEDIDISAEKKLLKITVVPDYYSEVMQFLSILKEDDDGKN